MKIDPESLPKHSNIHYLGAKKYDELPAYLAGMKRVEAVAYTHGNGNGNGHSRISVVTELPREQLRTQI